MSTFAPILQPGQKTTQAATAADLGSVFPISGNYYRLVKAAGAITAPAKKLLVTAVASGVPTWAVSTSTTASDPLVVGIVPSTLTADLATGDYFLVQISGVATCISAAAIASGALVGSSTTAGSIDDATITAGVGSIGVAGQAAGAGAVDTPVILRGLM